MKQYFQKDESAPMSMNGINWKEVQAFIDKMPDGAAGALEIKKKSIPKSKEALGYYYAVILPLGHASILVKQGLGEEGDGDPFRHTISINGQELKLPIDLNTTDLLLEWRYGMYVNEHKSVGEMDNDECIKFMDWCIKWLWQHYGVAVPPADKDWKNDP